MAEDTKPVILIIEDSPTMRLFYRKILELGGYFVIEAETGNEGWVKTYERLPHLVVLDMILPDMHGFEVLKKIRSTPTTKNIPVLVLTTLKEIPDVQKAINLGANYYSIKGTDSPEKLLGMIEKLLKRAWGEGGTPTESSPH